MHKITSQVIRLVRKARGLTQVQLAETTRINYRHLQDIESGKTDLKFSTVQKIAKAIKISGCSFLKEPKTQVDIRCLLDFGCIGDVLDHLPVAVQLNTLDGTIIYVNDFYVKNFTSFAKREDILGRKLWEFMFHEKDGEAVKKYLKELVKGQPEPTRFLSVNRGPKGAPVNIVADWKYHYGDDDRLAGFIAIIQKDTGTPLQGVTLTPSLSGQSI